MQVFDCSPYPLLGLAFEQPAFLIVCVIRNLPRGEALLILRVDVDRDLGMVLPFAQNHECGINCNPGEPGCELRSTIEASQVDESAHEPVLERILGVFTVPDNLVDRVKKTRSIDSAYIGKCRQITVQRS